MDRGNEDVFSRSFTGEHSHLANILREARHRIDEIDQQLKSTQSPRQPTNDMSGGRDNNFAANRHAQLLSEKSDVKRNAASAVADASKHNNVETQKELLDKTTVLLDEHNSYNALSNSEKPQEKSFEYMARAFEESKYEQGTNDPSERKHIDRASDRFNSMLNIPRESPSEPTAKGHDGPPSPISGKDRFNSRVNIYVENRKDVLNKDGGSEPTMSAKDRFNSNLNIQPAQENPKADMSVESKEMNVAEPSVSEPDKDDDLDRD